MKRLFVTLIMFGVLYLVAQPTWYYAKAPTSNDFYGRGTSKTKGKTDAEAKAIALQEAISDVSMQVFMQVKTLVQTKETESSSNSFNFLKEVQLESNVELCSYNIVNESIDKGTYYIVISVSRERLVNHYLNLLMLATEDAIASYESNMKHYGSMDTNSALLGFQQLRGKLTDLAHYTQICSALYNGNLSNAIPDLQKIPTMTEVHSKIVELQGNPRQSYSDLTNDIINQLPPQLKEPRGYLLSYIEWLNTGFSSDFSVAFSEHIAAEFERRFKWYRVSELSKPEVMLGGQLLPEADRINIIIRITGKQNHTCSTQLTPASINYFGVNSIKPQDLEEKIKNQKTLIEEAVQSGILSVKGRILEFPNSPAVFRLGNNFNLQVKVNKPCYITIINIEADGRWNVLTQNSRIGSDTSNEWTQLFSNVTVTRPTGVEQLLIQASPNRLPEYHVQEEAVEGGVKKITDKSISAELAQTRGLMLTNSDKDEYSEYYLTWTVMER